MKLWNLCFRNMYCNNKKEIELVFSSKQDWPHARKVSRWLQLLSFIAQANPQRLGHDFDFASAISIILFVETFYHNL